MSMAITEYKYIWMDEQDNGIKKTRYWVVRNSKSDDPLGAVEWYVYWRQYCFHANAQAVFSAGCLQDIADFCERMNKEQKAKA